MSRGDRLAWCRQNQNQKNREIVNCNRSFYYRLKTTAPLPTRENSARLEFPFSRRRCVLTTTKRLRASEAIPFNGLLHHGV